MSVNMITPQINASGVFKLQAPYSDFIPGTEENPSEIKNYTCVAIRKFSDIVGEKSDIKKVFYDEFFNGGYDQALFDSQVEAGVSIVTLRDSVGRLYYVPNSFILSVPVNLGYAYSDSYIVLKLSTHYLSQDLSLYLNDLTALLEERTGIESEGMVLSSEKVTYLDETDHQSVQTALTNRMTNSTSVFDKVDELDQSVVSQAEHIDDLYEIIDRYKQRLLDNNLPVD